MNDKNQLIKKLEQLQRDKQISPYDKDRILKMPIEKALKIDIIENTTLREDILLPESHGMERNDKELDVNQILKNILYVQKQQLDILEKTRNNTNIMVTWLIVIPVVLSVICIIIISIMS